MGPTLDRVYSDAYLPWQQPDRLAGRAQARRIAGQVASLQHGRASPTWPVRQLANRPAAEKPADLPFTVVVPAFVSELKTAFQVGFLIFIPFLVIDMVVASVLMSMGSECCRRSDDFPALQADPVRAGRRLEPPDRLARRQLLR